MTARSRAWFDIGRHTTPPTPAPPTPAPAPEPPTPPTPPTDEPKSYTQAQIDQMIGERLTRQKAQYAGFDDFKAKAEQFDAAELAKKTELEQAQMLLQQATERAETATRAANQLKLESAIMKAATAAGAGENADLVYAALDKQALTVGDDGTVAGLAEAVTKLLEAKPILKAAATVPDDGRPNGPIDQGAQGGQNGTVDYRTASADEVRAGLARLGR